MKKVNLIFAIVAIVFAAVSCAGYSAGSTQDHIEGRYERSAKAKYIFYFIGDGMSAAQLNLAEAAMNYDAFATERAASRGAVTAVGIGRLNIRKLPVTGLITTYAANRYITCSAAAATALATGEKTNIDFVSVSSKDGKTALPTIAEKAKEAGMKVGIVSSVSIDHATPACFYAHTGYRDNYKVIGAQLIESGFDYFGGGSPRWNKHGAATTGEARDRFVASAEAAGYSFVASKAKFDALNSTSGPVIATLEMLGDRDTPYGADSYALPYSIDINNDLFDDGENDITLAQFTEKGAEVLMNENGFFMMIESGKIDWACHANDAVTAAYEVVAFDEAIAKAIEFYNKYPEETLIVVTGDHDTGGLTLGFAGTSYENSFDLLMKQKISHTLFGSNYKKKYTYTYTAGDAYADVEGTTEFEGAFAAALAYAGEQLGLVNNITDGSDSDKFGASYDKASTANVDDKIGSLDTMTDAGSYELSNYEISLLKETFFQSVSGNKYNGFSSDDVYTYLMDFSGYDPFTTTCLTILCNKAGIEFSTYAHTAVPLPVFAMGAGAEIFTGYYDNTDVPKKISEAAALGL